MWGLSVLSCEGIFGSLTVFDKVINFASFQDDGKCENRKQWLNRYVKWNSGPLGRCLRHSFGIHQFHRLFLVWVGWFFIRHEVLLFRGTVVHGFRQYLDTSLHSPFRIPHISHVMWTDFPDSQQSSWLFLTAGMWGLKDHGAFGPSLFIRDCARGHITWGMTSRVAYFCFLPLSCIPSGHSVDCLGHPMKCRLHAGSLVPCHNFRILHLSCRRCSMPDSSSFGWRVDGLHA